MENELEIIRLLNSISEVIRAQTRALNNQTTAINSQNETLRKILFRLAEIEKQEKDIQTKFKEDSFLRRFFA
jgi:hypothetical protein